LADLEAARGRLGDVAFRRSRHVVTENQRVLDAVTALREGRLARLGQLIAASHASLRDDYEVSCAELDVAVKAAVRAGAAGARMTGGGFGGSALALVAPDRLAAMAVKIETAFADNGFGRPVLLPVTIAGGAGRLG
jgi:galactokinase